jgi:hypothetical protein
MHVIVVPQKEVSCTEQNTGFRFSPVIHKTFLFTAFTMSGACLLAAEYSAGIHTVATYCFNFYRVYPIVVYHINIDIRITVNHNIFYKFRQ